MNNSTPKLLQIGEWHIPFAQDNSVLRTELLSGKYDDEENITPDINELRIKVATAKCARVSYTTVGSSSNNSHTADIDLYNRLLESGHMSPFEHCAQVMSETYYYEKPYSRNFKGFIQYREIVETNLH
jgi:hypothetical protein